MTYETPESLRMALEARIRNESEQTGLSPDRLRRRVVFQRVVTRLQRAAGALGDQGRDGDGDQTLRCRAAHEGS